MFVFVTRHGVTPFSLTKAWSYNWQRQSPRPWGCIRSNTRSLHSNELP